MNIVPLLVVAVVSVVVIVVGQKPARIGDDGKPLLNRYYIHLCHKLFLFHRVNRKRKSNGCKN